ncbi:MAG: GHKL domain-containing protein, partial [Desulfobacterales bacterium]|nr:GHKL domain-containing protein [Desulfobacterales bacterium]
TEDKIKAFSVGGVDFITKPFRSVELLARVRTHLSLRSVQKGLERTLEELKETQSQLVESAKMAALGQLIAGVAHEINTPLGAIRASIGNISDALHESIGQTPKLFQRLTEEQQRQFFALIERAGASHAHLSSREERKLRRKLRRDLEEKEVENADEIADTLVEIGVFDDVDEFVATFRDHDIESVLNAAYNLIIQQKSAKNIEIAVDKASKVVFALKSYAHTDHTDERTLVDIVEGIEVVLTLYYSQMKHGVEVIKNFSPVPPILCYADELNQVWTNLLHNALQAMDNKGRLKIDVLQEDDRIVVSVTDSGGGVPPEIKARIFDPFFTTKPAGEGSGLGLDIVRKIIEKHQGRIELESEPGETTFTVWLPIKSEL